MAFPYRHFLVIGATAGIGQALSSRLLEAGAKVTVVGRRKDRLDEFVRVHVEQNARGVQFDISSLDAIPEFVAE
jgi:NAD(P)-dependent dehydrogenase (short-subunit alcohol dehydrogenase family)